MALQYKTLVTQANGPLVSGLTVSNFPYYVQNPAARVKLVNQDIVKTETGLPEGTRCMLVIEGLRDPFGNSMASQMAQQLQQEFEYGEIKDPATGDKIIPWPEHPTQIAWADDSAASITLRWVKGQPFAWILVGVAIVIIGIIIYNSMRSSKYSMSSATNAVSTGSGIIGVGASGPTIFGVPVWPNAVLIGTGIALAPAAIGWYGKTQHNRAQAIEAQRELERAEKGY